MHLWWSLSLWDFPLRTPYNAVQSSMYATLKMIVSVWSMLKHCTFTIYNLRFLVFCRCGSTGGLTHPAACRGRKQAAVLSTDNSQYGATAPAVHCLCGRERQSCLPRVNTAALQALSRTAQHECLMVWMNYKVICYIMIMIFCVDFDSVLLSLAYYMTAASLLKMHSPFSLSRLPFWKLPASVDSGAKIERELRTFSNRLKRHHLGEGVISLDEHSTSLLSNMVGSAFIALWWSFILVDR